MRSNLPQILVIGAAALTACSDSGPTESLPIHQVPAVATYAWNATARDLAAKNKVSQPAGVRMFAYLTLAQFRAADSAYGLKGANSSPPMGAAVTGASAVVLSYIFPGDVAAIDAQVKAVRDTAADAGFAAGEALGRALGDIVVAQARTDNFDAVWTGTVPIGDGMWYSAATPPAAPLYPLLGTMRPFFLSSGSQFRPPPPPTFGSPAYLKALAEVRKYSDARIAGRDTLAAKQDSLARFWAAPGGFALVQSYWNLLAINMLAGSKPNELLVARALAIMNTAAMDAFIACHDAKYTWWLIRPSEADPNISLSVSLPNHPSYPSNHACVSGASAAVLTRMSGAASEANVNDQADSAAVSRVYGGLHYRFDAEAGLKIGRSVAALALAAPIGHKLK